MYLINKDDLTSELFHFDFSTNQCTFGVSYYSSGVRSFLKTDSG